MSLFKSITKEVRDTEGVDFKQIAVLESLSTTDLTPDQKDQLIEYVTEVIGSNASREEFTDHLLRLLEDVPGFEQASQYEDHPNIERLIDAMWMQYKIAAK